LANLKLYLISDAHLIVHFCLGLTYANAEEWLADKQTRVSKKNQGVAVIYKEIIGILHLELKVSNNQKIF